MTGAKRIRLFLVRQDGTQQIWAEQARQTAQKNGCQLVEEWNEDPSGQTHQIAEAVWKNLADGLIILPASQSGPAALLPQALSRGAAVVLINQTRNDFDPNVEWSFPNLRRMHPKLLSARVAPDETEIGRVQARQVRVLLPKGGRILYVQGDTLSVGAANRTKGFEEVLGTEAGYTWAKINGNWTREGGEKAAGDWLNKKRSSPGFDLDMVVCQSDIMLPGVRNALVRFSTQASRTELAKIPITGCDGLEEVKREVIGGRVAATVELPSRTVPAVQLLVDFWRSGVMPSDPNVGLRPVSFPPLDELSRRQR